MFGITVVLQFEPGPWTLQGSHRLYKWRWFYPGIGKFGSCRWTPGQDQTCNLQCKACDPDLKKQISWYWNATEHIVLIRLKLWHVQLRIFTNHIVHSLAHLWTKNSICWTWLRPPFSRAGCCRILEGRVCERAWRRSDHPGPPSAPWTSTITFIIARSPSSLPGRRLHSSENILAVSPSLRH